mgnify:CR=1 FL=1
MKKGKQDSGVHEFNDVDPKFREWIKKAANFDPRKSKKG